jgi:hypothetical protein
MSDGRATLPIEHGQQKCDHGVYFPTTRFAQRAVTSHMSVTEIRECFPRHFGLCSMCGYYGIAYASRYHYVAGDW